MELKIIKTTLMTDPTINPHTTKPKACPSCGEQVERLQLSAFSMPQEQNFIPWLSMINAAARWSVRSFGQASLNELQFLCFTSCCHSCGLISWWDMGVEELTYTLNNPSVRPLIAWSSSPEAITKLIELLPDEHKDVFKKLAQSTGAK